MMALSGVRSSWLMLARNCDLVRLAASSSPALDLDLAEEPGVLDGQREARVANVRSSSMASGRELRPATFRSHW